MATDTFTGNYANELQESKIYFSTTNKGKPLLIHEDYLFKCNKTTTCKKYWLCVERGCCVYIHTTITDELILITKTHNHPADPDQLEAKLVRDKMKQRILTETTPLTRIYDEEIVAAKLSKAATAIMPTVTEFRSNMSKTRRKNTPVIPTSFMFEIPEMYQNTLSSNRYLFMNVFLKRGKDRILAFSSEEQLQLLFESDIIFMDGTFDITPAPFKQVYIINAHKFGQSLPVLYCLLPNRRAKTYTELFERLKEEAITRGKQFDPKRIVTDYEPSMLPVVEQEFPGAIHCGCMFHFNQAIHRNIRDLGLASEYLNNTNIRDFCRQLMALSLLPIDEVGPQFHFLQENMPTSLNALLSYFKNQWMYGVVPMRMWNFFDLNHRTNNTSEAYNLRFSTRLAKKHPNIWSFIQLIQGEAARFEHISIQLEAGASAPKQSKKTKAYQARIETLRDRYLDKQINARELLLGSSLLIGNKKK